MWSTGGGAQIYVAHECMCVYRKTYSFVCAHVCKDAHPCHAYMRTYTRQYAHHTTCIGHPCGRVRSVRSCFIFRHYFYLQTYFLAPLLNTQFSSPFLVGAQFGFMSETLTRHYYGHTIQYKKNVFKYGGGK